jgi:hypothetical protein
MTENASNEPLKPTGFPNLDRYLKMLQLVTNAGLTEPKPKPYRYRSPIGRENHQNVVAMFPDRAKALDAIADRGTRSKKWLKMEWDKLTCKWIEAVKLKDSSHV